MAHALACEKSLKFAPDNASGAPTGRQCDSPGSAKRNPGYGAILLLRALKGRDVFNYFDKKPIANKTIPVAPAAKLKNHTDLTFVKAETAPIAIAT